MSTSTDGHREFVRWFTKKHHLSSTLQSLIAAEHAWNHMSTAGKEGWARFATYVHAQQQQQPPQQPTANHYNYPTNNVQNTVNNAVPVTGIVFSGFELYLYSRMVAFKKICRFHGLPYSSQATPQYMAHLQREWLSLSEENRRCFEHHASQITLQLLLGFAKDLQCMQHPPDGNGK